MGSGVCALVAVMWRFLYVKAFQPFRNTERLLRVRHCCGHWEYSSGQDTGPVFMEVMFYRGKQDINHFNIIHNITSGSKNCYEKFKQQGKGLVIDGVGLLAMVI